MEKFFRRPKFHLKIEVMQKSSSMMYVDYMEVDLNIFDFA